MADRIREVMHQDAAVNAIGGLDGCAQNAFVELADQLGQLAPLFAPY
jgi:hypothetical protein